MPNFPFGPFVSWSNYVSIIQLITRNILTNQFVCLFFFLLVKVIKFNRRRPLPDAEDSDFLNAYNGMSNSISVTGYRSAVKPSLQFKIKKHLG